MSGKAVVTLSGFRDLDRALAELPKATARNTLRRTLVKAGEPIAQRAREAVPVDKGRLRDSIIVSPRIKNKVGNAEYSAAMRAGLGQAAAVRAMRDARRASGGSFATMHVGPTSQGGFYGHLVEFGTSRTAAQPFMRPAWDEAQNEALGIIKDELANQIILSARRIAKSKRQSVDVKYRASLAAMMAVEAQG